MKRIKERRIKINGKRIDYTVSENGDVYALNSEGTGEKSKVIPKKKLSSTGKLQVALEIGRSTPLIKAIDILVATAFVPNPGNFTMVKHIDGDLLNNNTSNLIWTLYRDRDSGKTEITEEMAHEICLKVQENKEAHKDLIEKYNISQTAFAKLINGEIWSDVSKQYRVKVDERDPAGYMYSDEQLIKVYEMLQEGFLISEIVEETGVSKTMVATILHHPLKFRRIGKNYDLSNYKTLSKNRRK